MEDIIINYIKQLKKEGVTSEKYEEISKYIDRLESKNQDLTKKFIIDILTAKAQESEPFEFIGELSIVDKPYIPERCKCTQPDIESTHPYGYLACTQCGKLVK